jgi:hypothetical protein
MSDGDTERNLADGKYGADPKISDEVSILIEYIKISF